MRLLLPLCVLLATGLSAAAAQARVTATVVVALETVGVDDEGRSALRQAVTDALLRSGAEQVIDLADACADRSCWSESLKRSGGHVLVELKVLRAGPVAQVSTVLRGEDGEPFAQLDHVGDAEALAKSGAWIPADLLDRLRAELPQGRTPPTDAAPTGDDEVPADPEPAPVRGFGDDDGGNAASTPDDEQAAPEVSGDAAEKAEGEGEGEAAPAPEAAERGAVPWIPVAVGGLAAALGVVGVGVFAGGVAVAVSQALVLESSTTSSGQKELAVTLVPVGALLAAGALVVLGGAGAGGAAAAYFALADE